MQKTCCLVVDTGWKSSVFIGHFDLLGGSSSDGKPREGAEEVSGRAKCSRQFVSWLILFIGNGVIGHLNLVSGGSDGGGGGVVHGRPNAAKQRILCIGISFFGSFKHGFIGLLRCDREGCVWLA